MSRPIDTDHLELYVAGDASLRDEILTIFQEQIDSLRARLDITANDEEWYDVMHAMKGASRGVGAWDVGNLCEKAEGYIKDCENKQAKRQAVIADLGVKLDEVIADADALRDGN